jgi:hypothetical protein
MPPHVNATLIDGAVSYLVTRQTRRLPSDAGCPTKDRLSMRLSACSLSRRNNSVDTESMIIFCMRPWPESLQDAQTGLARCATRGITSVRCAHGCEGHAAPNKARQACERPRDGERAVSRSAQYPPADDEARRTLRYMEPLTDTRTPLANFFSIL